MVMVILSCKLVNCKFTKLIDINLNGKKKAIIKYEYNS